MRSEIDCRRRNRQLNVNVNRYTHQHRKDEMSGNAELGSKEGPPAPRVGDDRSDPTIGRLVAAVDQLTDLTSEPVDGHAARFRDVHHALQDALSDTDGDGPQQSP